MFWPIYRPCELTLYHEWMVIEYQFKRSRHPELIHATSLEF